MRPGTMYRRLALSLVISGVVMYPLAFSQLEEAGHVHFSLATLYITIAMVAAMGIVMTLVMRPMLPLHRVNVALVAGFGVLLLLALGMGRNQALVGDRAFLRSMIPHHSRAVLVCREADLSDARVTDLCGEIIDSQLREIAEMEAILDDPR